MQSPGCDAAMPVLRDSACGIRGHPQASSILCSLLLTNTIHDSCWRSHLAHVPDVIDARYRHRNGGENSCLLQ